MGRNGMFLGMAFLLTACLDKEERRPIGTWEGAVFPVLTNAQDGNPALLVTEETEDGSRLRWAKWDDGAWMDTIEIAAAEPEEWVVNWADRPGLAFSDSGTAYAHWLALDSRGDFTYGLRTSRSTDGGRSWSHATVPHRDSAVAEHGFAQWVPGPGGASLVWLDGREFDGHPDASKARMQVRTAYWPDDSAWEAEEVLDSSACTCCPLAGTFVERDGGSDRKYVLAYRDRTEAEVRDFSLLMSEPSLEREPSWSSPVPLYADGWEIAACPVNGASLVSGAEGVLAVWFTAEEGDGTVRAAWQKGGQPTDDFAPAFAPPIQLNTTPTIGRVVAAVDGLGAYYAVWMQEDAAGEGVELVGRRWNGPDSERDAVPVALVASSEARSAGFPAMAGLPDGGVLLSWTVPGTGVRTLLWGP